MSARETLIATNPHRPVDYAEKAILKVMNSHYVSLQVKEDGCQLNLVVKRRLNGNTWSYEELFLSREGKAFPALKGMRIMSDEHWEKFFNPNLGGGLYRSDGGFMIQAEIMVLNADGTDKVCAETSGALARKEELLSKDQIRIVAFDLIPLDDVMRGDDYQVMQSVRMVRLTHQVTALKDTLKRYNLAALNIEVVTEDIATDLEAIQAIYDMNRKRGKEGLVIKDPMASWKRGKRVGQWKKIPDDCCDGTVVGLMWGTPGKANEGKVIGFTVLTEHGVEVEAGGITEDQKDEFTANVMKHQEVRGYTDYNNPYHGWTCKITYKERLPSGSYRHPNFSQFRGITDPLIKE